MSSYMQRRAQLRGRENLDALWQHLLDNASVQYATEGLRRKDWYAGVKYDYFRSDEGEALILELWDKNPELPLFSVLKDVWIQYHLRNNICF